jgi:diguanylate cyclase (GGDEF)-like protein
MQKPAIPDDEPARLRALRALDVLDTPAEERFDRLTRLAKRLFGVPIALVSLVDENRQWFKSRQGLKACETPRDVSFCGHTILGDDIFLVADAAADPRFRDNPLVTGEPHIRFYAGCPLATPDGHKIGTLCIIDRQSRELDDEDLTVLRDLARMAEQELAAVRLATMDELTLLSNRRGFESLAGQTLGLCRRLDRPAALLFFDLDGFKAINDRFGHAEGDHALERFAQILQQTFRESDVLARLGGDEFVALVSNCSGHELDAALQRLARTVEQYNRQAQRGYDIVYSVGPVLFEPDRHPDIRALLTEADARMYQDKNRER